MVIGRAEMLETNANAVNRYEKSILRVGGGVGMKKRVNGTSGMRHPLYNPRGGTIPCSCCPFYRGLSQK